MTSARDQLIKHISDEAVFHGDFTLTSGRTFHTVAPANYVTANPAFVADLAKKQVRIDVRNANDPSRQAAQKYFENVQKYYSEDQCRYFVRSLKEIGLSLPAQSQPEKRP